MKIYNIRLGFANNSSSSHSIIFLNKEELRNIVDRDCEEGQFGWQHFTAISEVTKKTYIGQILRQAFQSIMDDDIAIMLAMLLSDVPETLINEFTDGYIDHQSLYSLPMTWSGRGVHLEFFNEFKNFFLQPNLAILGGNDNTDEKHELDNATSFTLGIPQEANHDRIVARKDPEQGFWTLFNRSNGSKTRMSFVDGKTIDPIYSYSPELVDLKITDFCPYNCPMCYVDSTKNGRHANEYDIYALLHALSDLEVFEVAIGGGEPTLHPKFMRILATCKASNIVPNFTTKNYSFLRDDVVMAKVLKIVGSIAISVSDENDVEIAAKIIARYPFCGEKFSVQYVMGMQSKYGFKQLLENVDDLKINRLTLLGYKDSGRGTDNKINNKVYDYSDWFDIIKNRKNSYAVVAIDTVLAATWDQQLKDHNVPQWMYHVKDGGFSCYIDAVDNTLNESSYGDKTARKLKNSSSNKNEELEQSILEAYHSFQERPLENENN